MKTAQEAVGEYGVDIIKRIFDEELNEWDKKKVIDYIQDKGYTPESGEDLKTTLSYFADYEILDCLPIDSIRDYVMDDLESDVLDKFGPNELIDYLATNYPGELESYMEDEGYTKNN